MFRNTRTKPKRVLSEEEEDDGNVVYIPMEGNPNLVRRVEASVNVDGKEEVPVSKLLLGRVEQHFGRGTKETARIVWLIQHSQESQQALLDAFDIKSTSNEALQAIRTKSNWQGILEGLVTRFNFLKKVKREDVYQDKVRRESEDRFIRQAKDAKVIEILNVYLGPTLLGTIRQDPYLLKMKPINQRKALVLREANMELVDYTDVNVEYQFDQLLARDEKYAGLRAQIYDLDSLESRLVDQMEQVLEPLLMEGMRPLYEFVGQIEATEGTQKGIYKHFKPLIKGSKTLKEFKLKNGHLGDEIILMAGDYVRKASGYNTSIERDKVVIKNEKGTIEPIGIEYPRLTIEKRNLLGEGIKLADFGLDDPAFPQWVWCMIGSQCWKFMLSFSSYGAISMAAKELGYKEADIKTLIESDEVSYMFAQFVAHKFIGANKANAYASAIQGGQVQYRVSNGMHIRQANSKWLLGCKGWFRGVYWSGNPKREEEIRATKRARDEAKKKYDTEESNYIIMLENSDLSSAYSRRDLLEMKEETREQLRREGQDVVEILTYYNAYRESRELWREAESAYFLARCMPERTLRHRDTSFGFVTERDQQFYEDNMTNARLTANLMNQLRALRGK